MKKFNVFLKLAEFQYNYYPAIILTFLILTILFGFYGVNMGFESNINNEFPKNYDVFKYSDYITDNFAGTEGILVNIKIDENIIENPINEVTDKRVIQALYRLDGLLREESKIVEVQSLALPFKYVQLYPLTTEVTNEIISKSGVIKDVFLSEDKSATLMVIYPQKLSGKETIDNFVKLVEDKIQRADFPYGTSVSITGSPVLKSDLTTYLENDFLTTIIIAVVFISLLLWIIMKKLTKALLVMFPLLLGIVWFSGLVVILGFKLSISTVATGAMILGLGVEYSIFIYTKFVHNIKDSYEENDDKKILDSIKGAVGTTGRATVGSAMTTIAAFLALGISEIPMIQNLGFVSAIGISSVLILCIVFNPCIFVLIEKIKSIKKNNRGDLNVK